MNNTSLIEQLTWAVVEVTNPTGKFDTARLSEVLQASLGRAILAGEDAKRMTATLIRQVQVIGQ